MKNRFFNQIMPKTVVGETIASLGVTAVASLSFMGGLFSYDEKFSKKLGAKMQDENSAKADDHNFCVRPH